MITHEQVIELNNALIGIYGPDITHTVIVEAMEQTLIIKANGDLIRWGKAVAWRLVNNEYRQASRVTVFSDLPGVSHRHKLEKPNYFSWQNKNGSHPD